MKSQKCCSCCLFDGIRGCGSVYTQSARHYLWREGVKGLILSTGSLLTLHKIPSAPILLIHRPLLTVNKERRVTMCNITRRVGGVYTGRMYGNLFLGLFWCSCVVCFVSCLLWYLLCLPLLLLNLAIVVSIQSDLCPFLSSMKAVLLPVYQMSNIRTCNLVNMPLSLSLSILPRV